MKTGKYLNIITICYVIYYFDAKAEFLAAITPISVTWTYIYI